MRTLGCLIRSWTGRPPVPAPPPPALEPATEPATEPAFDGTRPRRLDVLETALEVMPSGGKYSVSDSSVASGVAGLYDRRDEKDLMRRLELGAPYRGGGGCKLDRLSLRAGGGCADGTTVCGSMSSSLRTGEGDLGDGAGDAEADETERHRDDRRLREPRERRLESMAGRIAAGLACAGQCSIGSELS